MTLSTETFRERYPLLAYADAVASATSRAAASRQSPRKRNRDHQRIVAFLSSLPCGATDEEMQDGIPMLANTQRPRRGELVKSGEIVPYGKRKTKSGSVAVVWVLAPPAGT